MCKRSEIRVISYEMHEVWCTRRTLKAASISTCESSFISVCRTLPFFADCRRTPSRSIKVNFEVVSNVPVVFDVGTGVLFKLIVESGR